MSMSSTSTTVNAKNANIQILSDARHKTSNIWMNSLKFLPTNEWNKVHLIVQGLEEAELIFRHETGNPVSTGDMESLLLVMSRAGERFLGLRQESATADARRVIDQYRITIGNAAKKLRATQPDAIDKRRLVSSSPDQSTITKAGRRMLEILQDPVDTRPSHLLFRGGKVAADSKNDLPETQYNLFSDLRQQPPNSKLSSISNVGKTLVKSRQDPVDLKSQHLSSSEQANKPMAWNTLYENPPGLVDTSRQHPSTPEQPFFTTCAKVSHEIMQYPVDAELRQTPRSDQVQLQPQLSRCTICITLSPPAATRALFLLSLFKAFWILCLVMPLKALWNYFSPSPQTVVSILTIAVGSILHASDVILPGTFLILIVSTFVIMCCINHLLTVVTVYKVNRQGGLSVHQALSAAREGLFDRIWTLLKWGVVGSVSAILGFQVLCFVLWVISLPVILLVKVGLLDLQ